MSAKFSKLTEGEVLSEQQFYTVIKKTSDKVQLRNDHNENIVVTADYVNKCLTSASQNDSSKTVSKTEAAVIFLSSAGVAMTVNFNKQVKEADVVKEIMEAYEGSTPKAMLTAVNKAVKKALQGVERTMIGRHYGEPNEFGRVNFIDMEQEKTAGDYDKRLRQVDPRTINWFIVRGVKYTVK